MAYAYLETPFRVKNKIIKICLFGSLRLSVIGVIGERVCEGLPWGKLWGGGIKKDRKLRKIK
jgi:hypothetical protein